MSPASAACFPAVSSRITTATPRATTSELLHRRLIADGHWLFRHRGILPFVLLIPLAWSALHFQWLGGSAGWQHAWNWVCVGVSCLGIVVRVTTVGFVPQGTSGRNTRRQVAATLNTTGWYSLTRNPLYLGNFLIGVGFPLTLHDPVLVLLFVAAFWLYYERIISAEEEFLSAQFGAAYGEWARRTPVFLPAWRAWSAPALPFCWRTVLRREHSSVLLVGAAYIAIAVAQSVLTAGRLLPSGDWLALLATATTTYVLLRGLKKRTRLLHVTGR